MCNLLVHTCLSWHSEVLVSQEDGWDPAARDGWSRRWGSTDSGGDRRNARWEGLWAFPEAMFRSSRISPSKKFSDTELCSSFNVDGLLSSINLGFGFLFISVFLWWSSVGLPQPTPGLLRPTSRVQTRFWTQSGRLGMVGFSSPCCHLLPLILHPSSCIETRCALTLHSDDNRLEILQAVFLPLFFSFIVIVRTCLLSFFVAVYDARFSLFGPSFLESKTWKLKIWKSLPRKKASIFKIGPSYLHGFLPFAAPWNEGPSDPVSDFQGLRMCSQALLRIRVPTLAPGGPRI